MLESWNMKKLLAIVVLGLMWITSGNADHYLGHKPGTGLDSMKPHLDSIQRNKNRQRSIHNQNEINRLKQEVRKDKKRYKKDIKKLEKEIETSTFGPDIIVNYLENHACSKINRKSVKFLECMMYPKIFSDAPIVDLFKINLMEGNISRQDYIEVVYNFTDASKEVFCNDKELNDNQKLKCKTNMKKLTAQLLSIAVD